MRIHNCPLTLSSTNMATASITSDGIWLGNISDFSIQVVFTGSPVGTFKLQASNDMGNEDKGNGGWSSALVTHWTDLDSGVAVSAAGNVMFNYRGSGFRYVRLVYTKDSGTGTITVSRFNGKGI